MADAVIEKPTTLDRLEAIAKRLTGGETAAAATNPDGQPAPVNKDAGGATDAVQQERIGGDRLAKGFQSLAKLSKSFRHLDTNKALDDPKGFLRQKHAGTDTFVVGDVELELMIQALLAQKAGDDVEGVSDAVRTGLLGAAAKGNLGGHSDVVRRALDTTSGAPLIRTDIEPFLYEAYLREFPVAERFARVPANGLVHTYEVRTAIPDGTTTNDIGDFSGAFTNSTYERDASTRISIIVSPVAIGLKLALAVQQSGMVNFNLQGNDNLEVMGAMKGIARKKQTLILQGNSSTAARTLDDEDGLYNALDHDGLRKLLMDASTSLTKDAGDSYRRTLRRIAAQIRNAGGSARNIVAFCSEGVQIVIDEELEEFYRITNSRPDGGVDTNLSANGIRLGSKELSEIVTVPAGSQGSGMGYYTFGGNVVEDIDVLDTTGVKIPYLGSPTPTILELPMGFDLKLARTFVPFEMSGLMLQIAKFHRKIRVPKQTV
jgi:hypothetical protein